MTNGRGSKIIAWISGAAIGAVVGVPLGSWTSWTSWPVGVVGGVAVALVAALSIRRGRGAQGWSDVDGESRMGEGGLVAGTSRPFVKGTPSAADLPVTPGMGAIGQGPTGTGS